MTLAGRVRDSISALKSESAWSPMPEHLLFLKLGNDTSPFPDVTAPTWSCQQCGMKFKSEAMLTYHQVGFCIGKSEPDGNIPGGTPFQLPSESAMAQKAQTAPKSNISKAKAKPEWTRCESGAVPPSAIKVGYDEVDQTHTYVCLVEIGKELLPGTVYPSQKHATVALNGEEFKATEYDVLADPDNLLSWRPCEVVGGIPCGATKGGYNSRRLQYYVARAKAPDGTLCCGQYVPQKQMCYFAWDGIECSAKEFEFLCKKSMYTDMPKSTTEILDKTRLVTRNGEDVTQIITPQPTNITADVTSPNDFKSYTALISANPTMTVSPDLQRKETTQNLLKVDPRTGLPATQDLKKSKTIELERASTQVIGKSKTQDIDRSSTQEAAQTARTRDTERSKTRELSRINTKEVKKSGTTNLGLNSKRTQSNISKLGTEVMSTKGSTGGTPVIKASTSRAGTFGLEKSGTRSVVSREKKTRSATERRS